MIRFLAHSANADGAGVPELLSEHLRRVAERAAGFAAAFGADEQAYAAGLLHDLGKYADQFQRRLHGSSERGLDHWSVGAAVLAAWGRHLGLVPALAVAGHHAGLGCYPLDTEKFCDHMFDALRHRPMDFTDADHVLLNRRFTGDGFQLPAIRQGISLAGQFAADMLDVRMLFSAIVDADFVETEAHFNGDAQTPRRPRPEGPSLDLDQAIAALDNYVEQVRHRFRGAPMNVARDALYGGCVGAAEDSSGLFTLSAPTGAGKTLAMLAFALHHARAHNMRRLVLVVPFLNIIDQTAQLYRAVFSPENGFDPYTVLEHHSLADCSDKRTDDLPGDQEEDQRRLLAENWDASIVLTTTVQFFESLMADRPSRCRKLHRLAQSVILFDEVQTLPPHLAVATLATLSHLADPAGPYRSTAVFATATQPAFDSLHGRVQKEFSGVGWQPAELVADVEALYAAAAGRVHVAWRHSATINLDDLASELRLQERMLCIVNLKRHAVQLAMALRNHCVDGLFHLSTNMCPAHRVAVLESVNGRLDQGLPVRLVATQCVEAGVDLDFPVVYRALAPLEAIAQAAGRCNRHGRGPGGQVIVFKPQDDRSLYPPGYEAPVSATETFLNAVALLGDLDAVDILNSPQRLRAYFQQFYAHSGRASSERDDERPLLDAIRAGDFSEVARLYKLIKQDSINVLVPYERPTFDRLRTEIAEAPRLNPELIRVWIRRASPHAVSLFRPREDATMWNHLEAVQFSRRHAVENRDAEWFTALPGIEYHALVGISGKAEELWIA